MDQRNFVWCYSDTYPDPDANSYPNAYAYAYSDRIDSCHRLGLLRG